MIVFVKILRHLFSEDLLLHSRETWLSIHTTRSKLCLLTSEEVPFHEKYSSIIGESITSSEYNPVKYLPLNIKSLLFPMIIYNYVSKYMYYTYEIFLKIKALNSLSQLILSEENYYEYWYILL